MLHKVDETLVCDHSKWKLLSSTFMCTVYFAVKGGSNFQAESIDKNPIVWPFKWKLTSSTLVLFILVNTLFQVVTFFIRWVEPYWVTFLFVFIIRSTKYYYGYHGKLYRTTTVEPRSTDTRLIRTPALYGQFRLSRQKAHIFSLKLTRFIRTPGNTDNGHFPVSRVTNSRILSTPLFGHWLSAHCLFSLT